LKNKISGVKRTQELRETCGKLENGRGDGQDDQDKDKDGREEKRKATDEWRISQYLYPGSSVQVRVSLMKKERTS
jgi:hypothetical protein